MVHFASRADASISGLLAGLFEPPSMVVDSESSSKERLHILKDYTANLFTTSTETESAMDAAGTSKNHGHLQDYVHVFSHIRMTYHIHRIRLNTSTIPQLSTFDTETTWMDLDGIVEANVTTGAKNILKALYDPPQLQDKKKKAIARKPRAKAASLVAGQKVVKVVKMPGS